MSHHYKETAKNSDEGEARMATFKSRIFQALGPSPEDNNFCVMKWKSGIETPLGLLEANTE